jgi:hypothetical protein
MTILIKRLKNSLYPANIVRVIYKPMSYLYEVYFVRVGGLKKAYQHLLCHFRLY